MIPPVCLTCERRHWPDQICTAALRAVLLPPICACCGQRHETTIPQGTRQGRWTR